MNAKMPIETKPVTLNSNQGVVLVRPPHGGVTDDHTRVDLVLARGASHLMLDASTAAQLGRALIDASLCTKAPN
ncbi:MAG: hypothetical protein AAGI06_19455 [Pseudomonadota bacterium]